MRWREREKCFGVFYSCPRVSSIQCAEIVKPIIPFLQLALPGDVICNKTGALTLTIMTASITTLSNIHKDTQNNV
jgi:hypothetical protein